MALLGDLVAALASGDVRVVDLTQPLSERTPVLFLPEPFANTPGAEPAAAQPLRRRRAGLGVGRARGRRARRHPLRRADPLDHRPRRRGRGQRAARPARRPGRGDRQVGRGRRGSRLPAHARRRPRLRVRARRAAGGRLAAAAHGLGRARRRPGRVPQRRPHARPGRRVRALAGRGGADRRLRRRDGRHRRGHRAQLRAAVPRPPLPARGGQVRHHPARQPGRAAADGRGDRRRAAQARRRDRQPVAGARLV